MENRMADAPTPDSPAPKQADQSAQKPDRHRLWMLAIIALFVLPVASSYLLFYGGWRPGGTVNYGALIQPPKPMEMPILDDRFGQAVDEDWIYGKWTMLYLAGDECDVTCREKVFTIAKVRLGQNRNVNRLQNVLMLTSQAGFGGVSDWLSEGADLLVVAPIQKDSAQVTRFFETTDLQGGPLGHVYLIDPQGNLMMRFPTDFDPTRMRKDLERLLKLSQVG